ncbi:hypothetical protein [Chitinilyticum litopenaei]|uniref:hypothetical protein n=1 Tax=Chitinilyticum litopenaei TaxID=1121276 RepID=UPI0003FB9609|nr:hypothetical protein [Chitinilyticum litopenaei]
MNCTGCGAPLAVDALVCPFCGLHNAVDLLAIRDFRLLAEHSELHCPNGCGDLQLLQLGAGLDVTIGFCPSCKGLKFAPGALQIALDKVAGQVREINHGRISAILAERVPREAVRYRPCPACGKVMHRHAYNRHIPLIVDDCREHGVWLDGGEFTVLAEWMEAGGAQMARLEAERRERVNAVLGEGDPELRIAAAKRAAAAAGAPLAESSPPSQTRLWPRWVWLVAAALALYALISGHWQPAALGLVLLLNWAVERWRE